MCFDAVGHLAITGFGRRDEQDVGPADPLGQLLREAALTTASSPRMRMIRAMKLWALNDFLEFDLNALAARGNQVHPRGHGQLAERSQ